MSGVALMQAAVDTFEQFGGHEAAGGFTLLDNAVFDFEDRLVEALTRLEVKGSNDLSQYADAIITPEEATVAFLKKVERLAPFGMQNTKPVFLMREVVAREVTRFGKSEEHLKLKIGSRDSTITIDAVTFFAKGALVRTADSLTKNSPVHLLVHLERDTFSRGAPVRLRLIDIKLV